MMFARRPSDRAKERAGCVNRINGAWQHVPHNLALFQRERGRCWWGFCAIAAVLLSGCGGGDRGPERVVVSGTVTYDGKPIADGVIRFVPLPTFHVPTTGAFIVDGEYKAEGKMGVPFGTHKIQIEAFRKVSHSSRPNQAMPPHLEGRDSSRQQYLPKRFNADSQLEMTIQPGSREITKNFDLTESGR